MGLAAITAGAGAAAFPLLWAGAKAPAPGSRGVQDSAPDGHRGPTVAAATEASPGAARFAGPLHDAFDVAAALEDTVFIDGFYRTPASPLYDRVLDRLHDRLRSAGYGDEGAFRLRWVATDLGEPAWWPISASLTLESGDASEILLAFAAPGDAHRTMLPVGAPDANVVGPVALALSEVTAGSVLVTRAPLSGQLVGQAEKRGATCVLSASLFPFTIDPTGGGRHLDAIQFVTAPSGAKIAVGKISPRVLARIEDASPEQPSPGDVPAQLRFVARVGSATRPLRTLVAEIVGSTRPEEAVAIASHLQEPGAGDNAAGAAGLAQSAVALAGLIQAGKMERPARTLSFVFGNEMEQSKIWLEHTDRTTVAALSADMLGQSPERTGAVALLERTPDPGALFTILPDEHTPWGAGRVSEEDLLPSGVNVVCREALIDVARHVGGWTTSENPWEGGSDHDVFNRRRIPAALMWHFTDFTYHTSLDRMDMIDGTELRRTCAAIVAAGLTLADGSPADLERHLASNECERELRKAAAASAENRDAARAWDAWCDGAAAWMRAFVVEGS